MGMHPSYYPNLLLRLIKWPIALLALGALPFTVLAILDSPLRVLTPSQYQFLAMGALAYAVSWALIFRHRFAGSYLSTFEHELTHALFAWATLHKVTGLTVTWRDGGACRYEGSGDGNWLITTAPYWFPTLALPPLLLTYWLESDHLPMLNFLTGAALIYHLTSTYRETHSDQPDLQSAGFAFSALFLPTANLLAYSVVVLIATSGTEAAYELLTDIWQRLWASAQAHLLG